MRSFTSTIKAARTAGITVIGMIKSITAASFLAARIMNSIPEATGAVTGEDGELNLKYVVPEFLARLQY